MLTRTRDNIGQQHGKTLQANHKQQNHQRGGNIRGTSWRTKGKSHYRPPTHSKRPHKGRLKLKENNLRSLPRRNQSLRQGVARRNHVCNAQKRTHKHPLASLKNLNQNLKAQLLTKHGLTEEFDIRDSIRQGGVLSVIQCALLMDEISKEINEEKKGKNLEGIVETTGSLLWMDDVLLISTDPNELQDMLNITNEIANRYHIEFGKEKRKS